MDTLFSVATSLFEQYEEFRLDDHAPATCGYERLTAELAHIVNGGNGLARMQEIGRSTEGRSLNLLSVGSGARTVMLWSQMHGDESTATLALLDILRFLVRAQARPWVAETLRALSIHCIPMLNPDGAGRRTRQNAVGIDINRDARAATSPEAQALLRAHGQLLPAFGFNLHDQDLRSVGESTRVAAVALLAPPPDDHPTVSAGRARAMCVGARIAEALALFVPGHVARYDDAYEARAFGDHFQASGTSTLLIESGHWPHDPEKAFIRKLNVVAILSALWSIAEGSCEHGGAEAYNALPPNGNRMFDLLVRGLRVQHANGWTGSADLGLLYARCGTTAVIKEIGDLRDFGGLETHMADGRVLPQELMRVDGTIERQVVYDLLEIPQGHRHLSQ